MFIIRIENFVYFRLLPPPLDFSAPRFLTFIGLRGSEMSYRRASTGRFISLASRSWIFNFLSRISSSLWSVCVNQSVPTMSSPGSAWKRIRVGHSGNFLYGTINVFIKMFLPFSFSAFSLAAFGFLAVNKAPLKPVNIAIVSDSRSFFDIFSILTFLKLFASVFFRYCVCFALYSAYNELLSAFFSSFVGSFFSSLFSKKYQIHECRT